MTSHSNFQHENNTPPQIKISSTIRLYLTIAGLCFIGVFLIRRNLNHHRDIVSEPGVAAFVDRNSRSAHQKQLHQNSGCSCSSDYTNEKSNKNEINSAGWNGFLVTDKFESADTVLRVRGGGSGGAGGESGGGSGNASGLIGGGAGSTPAGGSGFFNARTTPIKTSSSSATSPRNVSNTPMALRRTSSANLISENQSSSGVRNTFTINEKLSRCVAAATNWSACCATSDKPISAPVNLPAYELEFDAPPQQMMEKQPDSPTIKYRHSHAYHLTMDKKIELLVQPNKPHGVVCDGLVEEKRIDKKPLSPNHNPHTAKPGKSVFVNCGAGGTDRNICSAQVDKIIQQINNKHKNDSNFEPFKKNESKLEIDGLQARFCFPDHNGQLKVIIWAKDNKVNILPLSQVFYNERKLIATKIKEKRDAIVKTLSKLANIPVQQWSLAELHDFDHPIGNSDLQNMGFMYENFVTNYVPRRFNTGRKMDFNNIASTSFQTSIVEDTVYEIEKELDFQNTEDLYTTSANAAKLPAVNESNIRIQQESSIKLQFLETTRLIEYKSRHLRTNLSFLNLTNHQKQEFGIRERTHNGGAYLLFETQKLWKAYNNYSTQVNEMLSMVNSNYLIADLDRFNEKRDKVIEDLKICYERITTLGEIESNLLGFSRGSRQTKCALDTLRLNMKHTQDKLVDTIVQFSATNGQPDTTHEDIEKHMAGIRNRIENGSRIHDGASFEKNVNQCSELINQLHLDKNKKTSNRSVTGRNSALGEHCQNVTKNQVDLVKRESQELTPIIMDAATAALGGLTMGGVTISIPRSPIEQPFTPAAAVVGSNQPTTSNSAGEAAGSVALSQPATSSLAGRSSPALSAPTDIP